MKYIYKTKDYYQVKKVINYKHEYYGQYKTLTEAVNVRDDLIKHDWSKEYYEKNYMKKYDYIYKFKEVYMIIKKINGKQEYFGRYKNKAEAEEMRDYLIKNNWDKNLLSIRSHRPKGYKGLDYIYPHKDGYKITKTIDGVTEYFGVYESLEEAIQERDYYESCNWDWDLIVEETI